MSRSSSSPAFGSIAGAVIGVGSEGEGGCVIGTATRAAASAATSGSEDVGTRIGEMAGEAYGTTSARATGAGGDTLGPTPVAGVGSASSGGTGGAAPGWDLRRRARRT